jgi:nucleolar protein 14
MAAKGKQPGSNASALKRLKKSLSSAGLIGPAGATRRTKKKSKAGAKDPASVAERKKRLAQIEKSLNPFEVKITRQKYDVIGRKVKGVAGRPGLTKQIGEEKVSRFNLSWTSRMIITDNVYISVVKLC